MTPLNASGSSSIDILFLLLMYMYSSVNSLHLLCGISFSMCQMSHLTSDKVRGNEIRSLYCCNILLDLTVFS